LSNQLRTVRTKCSKIELLRSTGITPSKSISKHADLCLRSTNYSYPCKCVSSNSSRMESLKKMSGTSSSLEDKYWIDQHSLQSLHSIGYLKLHGTMSRSLKSQFQKHSLKYRIASQPIQRIGISGTTPSNLIHQREPPYLVSGTQNARTSSKK